MALRQPEAVSCWCLAVAPPPTSVKPLIVCCPVQTNCLEELTRPAPNHQGMAGRSDWVHIYHSVLPVLSLHQVGGYELAQQLPRTVN